MSKALAEGKHTINPDPYKASITDNMPFIQLVATEGTWRTF